jgi:hypothetical protein
MASIQAHRYKAIVTTNKASREMSKGVLHGVLVVATCLFGCVEGVGGVCPFLREPSFRTRKLRLDGLYVLACAST